MLDEPLKAKPLTEAEREMIRSLRLKGYRVYPVERCRLYESIASVDYRMIGKASDDMAEKVRQRAIQSTWHQTGEVIGREGAMVTTRSDDDGRRVYRTTCMVILPNDFDFEAEAWGIR